MSSICLSIEYEVFLPGYIDRAVSEDANQLKEIRLGVMKDFTQNVTSEPVMDTLEALREIYKECSTNNWDGYGAPPIKEGSYCKAEQFIKNFLFVSLPCPEVTIDPDGEVVFEWRHRHHRIFSISVGNTGTLTYAGIFGSNKTHGIEDFEDAIPKTIFENVKRVFS